jgi:hypothetical protein
MVVHLLHNPDFIEYVMINESPCSPQQKRIRSQHIRHKQKEKDFSSGLGFLRHMFVTVDLLA